ncbi:hypothetical protein MRX96_016597 [Rhipicephalus microplus]
MAKVWEEREKSREVGLLVQGGLTAGGSEIEPAEAIRGQPRQAAVSKAAVIRLSPLHAASFLAAMTRGVSLIDDPRRRGVPHGGPAWLTTRRR